MILQEIACFLICLGLILHAPLIAKTWFDPLWIHAYGVSVGMIFMNNIRTLGAHRWTGPGSELSFEQQLLDSCDYPHRPWITELWGPTGTRYHATHHLFPSLPYHNLGIAHRRLMAELPPESLFRETAKLSLLGEIAQLWQRSSQAASRSKVAGRIDPYSPSSGIAPSSGYPAASKHSSDTFPSRPSPNSAPNSEPGKRGDRSHGSTEAA
jgi:fatty acid desaturase